MRWLAFVGLLALLALTAQADLTWTRTHLVDYYPKNQPTSFFFRSNQPSNSTHFQYDLLMMYMNRRAQEAGIRLPEKLHVIDISLATPFDKGFSEEAQFWADNPEKGEFVWWPLGVAGILRPSLYPEEERRRMIKEEVWTVDQIPGRIGWVNERMRADNNTKIPIAILAHCAAGCDRTGEFVGSYRMRYMSTDANRMYKLNTEECGRSPNYWSTSALEWFCWTQTYEGGRSIGDCDNFAQCKPFGDCEPKQSEPEIYW